MVRLLSLLVCYVRCFDTNFGLSQVLKAACCRVWSPYIHLCIKGFHRHELTPIAHGPLRCQYPLLGLFWESWDKINLYADVCRLDTKGCSGGEGEHFRMVSACDCGSMNPSAIPHITGGTTEFSEDILVGSINCSSREIKNSLGERSQLICSISPPLPEFCRTHKHRPCVSGLHFAHNVHNYILQTVY